MQRRQYVLLAVVSAACVAACLGLTRQVLTSGIVQGADTPAHIAAAEQLVTSGTFAGRGPGYSGYVVLLAGLSAIGAGPGTSVPIQLVVAAVACGALFDLGRRIRGVVAGAGAAGFYAFYPDLTRWHAYVLTESLFMSMAILAVWGADRARAGGLGRNLTGALAAFVAGSLRPNGWGVALLCWVYQLLPIRPLAARLAALAALTALVLAVTIAVVPAASAIYRVGGDSPGTELMQGVVIGLYEPARHQMPPADDLGVDLGSAAVYAVRHPVPTLALAADRVVTEVRQTRPYYSTSHNLLISVVVWPLDALAVVGAIALWRRPVVRLAIAIVLFQLAVIAAVWADWDGRYFQQVLPLVGLLGAAGFAWLYALVRRRQARDKPGIPQRSAGFEAEPT